MSTRAAVQEAASKLGFTLKKEQEEAILAFNQGHDVFVALPTGYGKSFCYCCLPYVFDIIRNVKNQCIVVVVSPLKALMKDQVAHCLSRGLSAADVSSASDRDTRRKILEGCYQIVFMSPESLFTGKQQREMLQEEPYHSNLVGFVIDEAHCVKKW